MKKYKEFAIQSDNPNLIEAFNKECKEKGIKTIDEWRNGYRKCLHIINDKEFRLKSDIEIQNFTYHLPEQWNQAIEALDNITQPEYEVNDWVIYNNKVYKVATKKHPYLNLVILNNKSNEGSMLVPIHSIERHATQEEIKQHLLSLTDIKEGDLVKDIRLSDRTYKVKKIMLSSEANPKPGNTSYKYYSENGDHLVMTDDKNNCIPLDQCEKVDDLSVTMMNGKVIKPKIKNNIHYGCVRLSNKTLNAFKHIMLFCQHYNIDLHVNEDGEIDHFESYEAVDGGEVANNFSINDVNKLIEKLK